jgi:LmbE family N-acetylglucosaminyl deacetylase
MLCLMQRVGHLLLLLVLLAVSLIPTHAQVRPIYDRGAGGLMLALQRLQTTASALHTGAHPDDEDSAFIARMARGDHARVAYLSLNRGEGGQNVIGPELFDALGVIRTEELLQARRLDGGEQFFTRSFDYGFSKTLDEAKAKWDEQELLGDMVRIIRTFRPLVIYSRFTGTPADGHGQHQMAGYLTPLAFKAAADPAQFPEQLREGLRTWQVKKLYRGGGGPGGGGGAPAASSVQIEEGSVDPVLGRSYAEISLEGRSQHKTQEMGTIELRGPAASTVLLVESQVQPPRPERSIFDGIDVTLPGLAQLAGLPGGSLRTELAAMDAAVKKALADYSPLNPAALVPTIAEGLRATRAARTAAKAANGSAEAKADADFLLAFKERDFIDALARAAGVDIDPIADEETVVQGTSVGVAVRTFLPTGSSVTITSTAVHAPDGWAVSTAPAPASGGRGAGGGPGGRRETATNESRYRVAVPADAPVTQPYFLEQTRVGASYAKWDDAARGLPFAPALLTADVTLQVGSETITLTRPIMFRFADRVRGELRRDVNIVPALGLGLDSKLLIVPLGKTPFRQRVVVRTTSYSSTALQGTLRLKLPDGWTSDPVAAP